MTLTGSKLCFLMLLKPLFFFSFKVRCDQRQKMLIFRYTCEKSRWVSSAATAPGVYVSDLCRCYISQLESLVSASLFVLAKKNKRRQRKRRKDGDQEEEEEEEDGT